MNIDNLIKTMIVKILYSITKKNIEEVKHFINQDTALKLTNKIANLDKLNHTEIYEEVNVSDIKKGEPKKTALDCSIDLVVTLKYINYIVDANQNIISGDPNKSFYVPLNVTISKKNNLKEMNIIRKCPSCGASMDIYDSGKCKYCGTIYNFDDYNWIITNIDI